MSDALSNAHSLKDVIAIINQPEASEYFGGADMRSAEQLAGQYAYDAAVDSGYISDADIEAQLENLYDAGANFNWSEALEEAINVKKH